MDFSLSDEQQMLLDTTRRFIASEYSFAHRAKVLESAQGWSRDVWRRLGELGVLAVDIPEEDGGVGAGAIGVMLVAQAIGEGLLLEPFLSSAVVATRVIVQLGSALQRERWLPALASGEQVAVLAHDEEGGALDVLKIAARAIRNDRGWSLSGRKSGVYHAPAADVLLVSALIEDGTPTLFVVPAGAARVRRADFRTVDGQCAADLVFDAVDVAADSRLDGDVAAALATAIDRGTAALCAEAIGTLDRVLKATIEYSRSRVQFGVPIGSFQALQHRMADMLMHVEQARSMSYLATSRCTEPDAQVRRMALSRAKALIGQAARFVGQQAVQLHGGMGMTDELDVSHCFKRLLAFELRFGTADEHLDMCRQDLLAT
ncbi:MAG: acyl-CoA dehydrogenase [Rudaea sp.]|nr:acyl-CoA dehydrogenase [Rudaea sp.]